jgi:hypothetical protein
MTVIENPTTEQQAETLDEQVADIAWHAHFYDAKCLRHKYAIERRLGMWTKPYAAVTLSVSDALALESMLGTDFTLAVADLTMRLAPAIRRRINGLGNLIDLESAARICDLPGVNAERFLRSIFRDAGIEDRFRAGGLLGADLRTDLDADIDRDQTEAE